MKNIQLVGFFVNQGESRICENHEIFTLKNKILSLKEIKHDVYQSTFIQLYRYVHTFIIGGLCQMLWTVKGNPYTRASLGTCFGRLADHSTTSAA